MMPGIFLLPWHYNYTKMGVAATASTVRATAHFYFPDIRG